MSKFALIGNPIRHSQSPALFKAAYPHTSDTYDLIEANTAEKAISKLLSGGYSAANVTAPFKEDVMRFVTYKDEATAKLGCANVLIFNGSNIYSHNTDYLAVREIAKKHAAAGTKGDAKKAVVAGAGGAGKAAALALADEGFEVTIANRSREKAEPFALSIGAEYVPLANIAAAIHDASFLVYALPLRIKELSEEILSGGILSGITVLEANYRNPSFTNADRRNIGKYLGGMYWLAYQAIPSFRFFTGKEPDKAALFKFADLII